MLLAAGIGIFLVIAFASGVAVFFSPLITHYV